MPLRSIQLQNLLSYGEKSPATELRKLNVIIGANGSGKSNLIDALELLRAAPSDLHIPIRNGGGVSDWLRKKPKTEHHPVATISINLQDIGIADLYLDLQYTLRFAELSQRFLIFEECIQQKLTGSKHQHYCYQFQNGRAVINVSGQEKTLSQEDFNPDQSILSQRKDPELYPALNYIGKNLAKIRIYREWDVGRHSRMRQPQKTDLPNDFLEPDGCNLGLVLNRLERDQRVKNKFLNALQDLYEGIDGYDLQVEGGTMQIFLHEGEYRIPATRLSDGTLRYLCLLAVLCHPEPPPLVCIEEPELGLHPDVLPTLTRLMQEASERCQLIVTTHSDILVDALSDQPESVLVAEKTAQGTTLTRLDAEKLKPWLKDYGLGQLWTRGDIGGKRW